MNVNILPPRWCHGECHSRTVSTVYHMAVPRGFDPPTVARQATVIASSPRDQAGLLSQATSGSLPGVNVTFVLLRQDSVPHPQVSIQALLVPHRQPHSRLVASGRVSARGFEPLTSQALSLLAFPICLHGHWCSRRESNPHAQPSRGCGFANLPT